MKTTSGRPSRINRSRRNPAAPRRAIAGGVSEPAIRKNSPMKKA
jgi:hypothetical protein